MLMPTRRISDERSRPMELHTTVESRPGAAITVRRIEMPEPIKAAISARIDAARRGDKVSR
jgi:hypothetical protein